MLFYLKRHTPSSIPSIHSSYSSIKTPAGAQKVPAIPTQTSTP